MAFLTNEKLTIVGAAGMIGSNMVQTALTMGLTNNICLYDVFSPEGVAEEMRQSGFFGRCAPQGRHDTRRLAER